MICFAEISSLLAALLIAVLALVMVTIREVLSVMPVSVNRFASWLALSAPKSIVLLLDVVLSTVLAKLLIMMLATSALD